MKAKNFVSARPSFYAERLAILLIVACAAAVAQQLATVRQILVGTMLPGLEVATFEHSEMLYPFSPARR